MPEAPEIWAIVQDVCRMPNEPMAQDFPQRIALLNDAGVTYEEISAALDRWSCEDRVALDDWRRVLDVRALRRQKAAEQPPAEDVDA